MRDLLRDVDTTSKQGVALRLDVETAADLTPERREDSEREAAS